MSTFTNPSKFVVLESPFATVVYIDRGISTGMEFGIKRAKDEGRPVEYRSIEDDDKRKGDK